MIVQLTQLEQPEISVCEAIEVSEIEWDEEDVTIAEAIQIKVNITKGDVQVRVEGLIDAKLNANCSRCFEEVKIEKEIIFKADYVTRENFSKELELELKKEDLDVSIFDGENLDLAEVVREQILLSLPTQILCRDDCKGLCGICWANLNKQSCNCHQSELQMRWIQLKSLN
ncbi:MAG: DUF177 domain-containing protein [Acidobacteria bacterium]|jgi:uncharacterized protein|nr:MAG: DUF177 domain-containing protein [Acidobacteriota bacterium]GIU81626.1 MAG: hypothetical protein KatS3mg006_0690 [Pyrinomonadaceae bacterium]